MKKRLIILVMILAVIPIGVATLWGVSDAATVDTAAASVDPAIALVGQPVTFTSTNPCTIVCSLTWRRPDIGIARFGGVIVGQGQQFTMSFPQPGTYEVVLDMGEVCAGTSRLVCHSFALVFVSIVADLPAGTPLPPDTTTTLPADTTTTLPADTTTTLPPDTTTTLPADTTTTVPVADTTTTVPADTTTTVPVDDTVTAGPTSSALVAPSDLSLTTVRGRNRLTWTDPVSSATSLILERCQGTGCTSFRTIAVLDLSTTSFIESHMRHGSTDISYRLAASDETGTVYSNIQATRPRR